MAARRRPPRPVRLADDAAPDDAPDDQVGMGLPPTMGNGSLRRLRIVTGIILATLVVLMVVGDMVAGVLGPIRADYHVEPIVFGTILGGLLLIAGIELGSRWPWGGGGGS